MRLPDDAELDRRGTPFLPMSEARPFRESARVDFPLSWHILSIFLIASVVSALVFLAAGTYERVAAARGTLVPKEGLLPIAAPRGGLISSIDVREGQSVAEGAKLVTVRPTDFDLSGRTLQSVLNQSIKSQDAALVEQIRAAQYAGAARRREISDEIAGIQAELAAAQSQEALQTEMVASSLRKLEDGRKLAEKGFISKSELAAREENWLARRQQLAQLRSTVASKNALINQARGRLSAMDAELRSQILGLRSSQADLAQRLAAADAQGVFTVTAPKAGQISGLTAREGQLVAAQSPLMWLVPTGSALVLELQLPSESMGAVKAGQEVRIALDAYPYQRFGVLHGRLTSVSKTAVSNAALGGAATSVFLAQVEIPDAAIVAFGPNNALRSGMTATVRIVTMRQSLLEWLFEPLFAVSRR